MPEKQFPLRPNLDQYKKQARELMRACARGDAEARVRIERHHPQPPRERVFLSDAQLVLAREHGFASWPKFARAIEQARIAQAMEAIDDPVAAFLRAASVPRGTTHASGTLDEAEALRARFPAVERADLYTAAVLGDAAAFDEALRRDVGLATRTGGPHGWSPLVYLCFSRYLRLDKARGEGFVRAARLLLEAGANAKDGWYEQPDAEGGAPVWESVLYGAAGLAHHAGVARLLLEYGADPNDGETPYHVPEGYDNTVMRVLLESGRLSAQSKNWLLVRKADWHDYEGMRMALELGADPDFMPHWGRNALQHAIQRDNALAALELLLDHGANPLLRNSVDGRTAVAMAAHRGRGDFLLALESRGFELGLDGPDLVLAACAKGDMEAARILGGDTLALRQAMRAYGASALAEFAGNGNVDGVRCLLELGVDVDARYGGDGYFDMARDATALHAAAWRGWPQVTRLLLERGAGANAVDGRGRTPLQLAVRACVQSYWMGRRSPEWIAPLLTAGAKLDGIEIPCGYDAADALLRAHAARR